MKHEHRCLIQRRPIY